MKKHPLAGLRFPLREFAVVGYDVVIAPSRNKSCVCDKGAGIMIARVHDANAFDFLMLLSRSLNGSVSVRYQVLAKNLRARYRWDFSISSSDETDMLMIAMFLNATDSRFWMKEPHDKR